MKLTNNLSKEQSFNTYPFTHLANDCYNWMQVDEIYTGLLCGIDVSRYADRRMSWLQMCEIRKQLEREMRNL